VRTTRIEEAELLEAQLVEALAETRRAEGHAFEVVALAGLRERLAGEPAALAAVDEWLDADGAVLLADEIADLELDRRIDELVGLPDDAHEERVDGTFAIDELSAGLTFCGNQARIAPFIELLGRAIQATPAPWCALSPLASRILESAPPLDDDPAGGLWRDDRVDAVAPGLARARRSVASRAGAHGRLAAERTAARLAGATRGGPVRLAPPVRARRDDDQPR
jgi:hypothetical protein